MSTAPLAVEQQIKNLEEARRLVLADSSNYPPIIQGILPLIVPGSRVELRRWIADFLAETFATPHVPASQKEGMSLLVLETLRTLIENPQEDAAVIKSVVQTAASIYPLVVRWIINNSYDSPTWERMVAIKTRILRIWDTAVPGVRICCIKFAQRVVLVQTNGPDADPRRGEPIEVSLSMVPANHPLIPPRNLEAEASGLLDRMLAVFQENSTDAVLVDATLNSLSILIRARPHIANKILNIILNFNPLKQANSPMTPKIRVMVKSMEKTTRSLLIHILKRDPQNPLAGRIQQYVERMVQTKNNIFDDINRKRGPPEPTDGIDPAKRQKLQAQVTEVVPKFHVPPLRPGSHSLAGLFTVTEDEGLKAFDVGVIPEDLVVKICIMILQKINAETLSQAGDGIRQRLKSLEVAQPELLDAATAPLGVDEDDDDYEPDFYNAEDNEQILNKLDNAPPPEEIKVAAPDMALARFVLPFPQELTPEQVAQVGQGTVSRVFGVMQTLEDRSKKTKAGLNRLAASSVDKDAWITLLTRLATRTSLCLEEPPNAVKLESETAPEFSLANDIRENLYTFIMDDFRKRMDIAIQWLSEEWYNDKVQMKLSNRAVLHYEKWSLKVLDGIFPYLDGKDRALVINLLSQLPEVSNDVLERVKRLCGDPATVTIALQSLLYLVMFRPPVREQVLRTVREVCDVYEDARPMAKQLFKKWIPDLGENLEEKPAVITEAEETKTNGQIAIAAS